MKEVIFISNNDPKNSFSFMATICNVDDDNVKNIVKAVLLCGDRVLFQFTPTCVIRVTKVTDENYIELTDICTNRQKYVINNYLQSY